MAFTRIAVVLIAIVLSSWALALVFDSSNEFYLLRIAKEFDGQEILRKFI